MTHDELLQELMKIRKLDYKMNTVHKVSNNLLFDI